jgi:L-iditol 2-dehydrogenase
VVWRERGVAVIEDVVPPALQPGEVRLRILYSLISPGTERAFFLGLPNAHVPFPQRQFGYNAVGVVEELAPEVRGLRLGESVVAAVGHGSFGVTSASGCHPLPAGLEPERAVFFNMITIALHGVRRAAIEIAHEVAVVGMGMVGLLALRVALLRGARVIAIEPASRRRKFAKEFGADIVLASASDTWRREAGAVDLVGADVVIEASGHPDAIAECFRLARPRGRVVLLGSTRGLSTINFYEDVHSRGLTVVGAHNLRSRPSGESHEGNWRVDEDQLAALWLLRSRDLNVDGLVTHRFAGRQAPEAYRLLASADPDILGIVLDWTNT